MSADGEWMSARELSELTGLSLDTLANLRSARKRFPYYKPGKFPLYKRAEIFRIVEASRVEVRP